MADITVQVAEAAETVLRADPTQDPRLLARKVAAAVLRTFNESWVLGAEDSGVVGVVVDELESAVSL
jgi:hypothetical protein